MKNYDKGENFIEKGQPGESALYYERFIEKGETLSIQQRGNLIESKEKCGDFIELQKFLEAELQKEEKN